ncbi:MAG: flagellar motor switch protein FliG [Deltaproteobacteria bacterium]|nr:flagellar motor switch protein FliG [Deltaproteobacteria bacterium]
MASALPVAGARKAALFLMIMGEEFTSQVFKHLDESEVRILGEQMTQVKQVDPKVVSSIMDEFSQTMNGNKVMGISGKDFLQKSVSRAFDTRKADDLLGDVLSKGGEKSFEKLSSMNPQIVANLLMNEHPQTIALILVNMKYQTAADIMRLLPENVQGEVIIRIADLEDVPDEIVEEVHEVVDEMLSDIGKETGINQGGIETAAEILNQLDHKTENAIFEKIESTREDLADEIRQKMFIFADLVTLDDRSIRALLKEVGNDELILALKTASDDLADKIFSNVSQRAAEMMREDMEVMGPVKLRDVEQAQLSIVKSARILEEEGKIILGGKGGEEVLV